MKPSMGPILTVFVALETITLAPSVGYTTCDDEARELQEQYEEAQISASNDAAILNLYSKHNNDVTSIMRHGTAPTDRSEHEKALSNRLQENQQTFDRRQNEIEAGYREGSSAVGAPCEQGDGINGRFPRSLPGLYGTSLPVGNKQSNFIYLFADGTFFHQLPPQGFATFDFAEMQKDQLWRSFTGRYTVRDRKVILRYAPGGYEGEVEITVNEQGYFPNRSGKDYVQLAVVDEMKLAGTYQLVKEQLPVFFSPGDPPLPAFVTFMPDGKFTDGGVLSLASQLMSVTNANTRFKSRPGSGTYSLKDFTLHLLYSDGRKLRFNFHVRSSSTARPNLNRLYVAGFRFIRVEPLPFDHLPVVQVPSSWKSQRTKETIYFIPPDLPEGRSVVLGVRDPQPLPVPDASRFPGRLHAAAVEGGVKNLTAGGFHTETTMRPDVQGKIPTSSKVFKGAEGKKLWVTIFTLVSNKESQFVIYMADQEELYNLYLPTVKAMLGDGE